MDPFSGIIDDKILSLVRLFLKDPKGLYHIHKAAHDADVPVATTFRMLKKLVDLDILEIVPVEKTKLYRLADNRRTKILGDVL